MHSHVPRLISLSLFIALFFTACGGPPPPAPKLVPPLGSRMELAAGDVWLVTDSEKKRLITGAMLPEEAGISLGDGARALVRLGDGTGVFMRGGTEILIKDDSVTLKSGELWADVPADEENLRRFVVSNTTITASGAGFDLLLDDKGVHVYVARGLAVVASPHGREEVQNGERATVGLGEGAPVVEPVGFWEDWTGGMADRELSVGRGGKGSGRIYGIDRANPGSAPQELHILTQEVRAIIRDGIAHTTVDQRFFNPSNSDVEGWYWFTVPEGASVERFALEVNGYLVEGEMTERNQAAEAYEEAIQKDFDPALLEWVEGRTFRARIYPIPASGERRVVLSYTQFLPLADGIYRYVYPMGGEGEKRIQEFSLQVILGDEGENYEIATLQDARVEDDSSMISMRRSGFVPRSDFLLELRPVEKVDPLRVVRYSSGRNEADFVMLRYAPDVDWAAVKEVPGDVVVVLDTSAGGGETERQIRSDAAEAILRALSDGDRFAVVASDLTPRVVFPDTGLINATEENVSLATEKLSEVSSAGATDLGEMFSVALGLVHEAEQPAVVYVGDGRPTVGETTSMELAERLRRSLGDSRARLFTIAVGAEANHSLLERLSRMGGGRSFRIDTPEQTVQEAIRFVGLVKTPTITDLSIDAGAGLDQSFATVAGKVSEGKEIVLLARTHHKLPEKIRISGRLAGESFEREYETEVVKGEEHGYVPSLWARMYLERLMGEGRVENRGTIISLGLSYALMTPYTSFLVLESDQAYYEAGIARRHRHHTWTGFDTVDTGMRMAQVSQPGAGGSEQSYDEDVVMEEADGEYWNDELGHYRQEKSRDVRSSEVAEPAPPPAPKAAPSPVTTVDASSSSGYGGLRGKSGGARRAKRKAVKKESRGTGSISGKRTLDRLTTNRPLQDQADDSSIAWSRARHSKSSIVTGGEVLSKLGTGRGKKDKKKKAESREKMVERILEKAIAARPAPRPAVKNLFTRGVCSDASRRPLSQRRLLWQLRLARADTTQRLAAVFFDAGSQCELPRWKHQRELLAMIERRVQTPSDVYSLLALFDSYPRLQKYLRKRIIRRTLDPDMTMHLYEPSTIDWYSVRRGLAAMESPKKRLVKLRKILEHSPEDPAGRALLIELLLDVDEVEEARAVASRLRRDEQAGPLVLGTLCDLQSEVGMEEEARRTCSELVEFNETDPSARARLGDLFLRHGWYEAAYRQYRTLVAMLGESPEAALRLAMAAAGMGKVDEALRIERRVAAGEGETGPRDPRRWARLHSAIKLARMMMAPDGSDGGDQKKALERSLKRTRNFSDPMTLVLLVWEDFDADLKLVARRGKEDYTVSDRVESTETGLVMIDLGRKPPKDVDLTVEIASVPLRRAVPFSLVSIVWDGEKFSVSEKKGTLKPRAQKVIAGR